MSTMIDVDSLSYARRLEQAGFSRSQAEAQAEVLKEHGEILRAALQPLLRFYDETTQRDFATRGDVMDTRLEIERVRAETEKVRAEVEKVRADLKIDIEQVRAEVEKVRADLEVDVERVRAEAATARYDLLKWQIGIGLGLVAVMAKGFGWIGF